MIDTNHLRALADAIERADYADPVAASVGFRVMAGVVEAMERELIDLRHSVVAFGGPWAAKYAEERGLPPGHLHPMHYDILAKAGARMDDFIRAEPKS